MTTLVGTQKKFSDALVQLLELEYDALETYTAAIDRLENDQFKKKLSEFREDHQKHIQALEEVMTKNHVPFKKGPCGKQILMIGKVALSNLMGDKSILKAMISVEDDSNKAYERMNQHEDKDPSTNELLKKAWEDEKRHREWLLSNTQ